MQRNCAARVAAISFASQLQSVALNFSLLRKWSAVHAGAESLSLLLLLRYLSGKSVHSGQKTQPMVELAIVGHRA